MVSELLFECYKVPGVAYGVDSLFSLSQNKCEVGSSLVISIGYQSTHILPVVEGSVDWAHCRRIDIGGCHITGFLHRLLQLKYPSHFAAITLSRAEVSTLILSFLRFMLTPTLLTSVVEQRDIVRKHQNKGKTKRCRVLREESTIL